MFLTLSYNLLKSVNNTCKKCTSWGDVTYTCKKVLEVFFTELYSGRVSNAGEVPDEEVRVQIHPEPQDFQRN